jgi:hypothetical protein
MVLHIVANRPHLVDLFEQFIYDVSASICTHPSRSHIDRHFSKAAVGQRLGGLPTRPVYR